MPAETFPPARSALNLRLVLASGGALLCLLLGLLALSAFGRLPAAALFLLAVIGLVDVVVLLRRKRGRARAHRGRDHGHDSLFE